MVWIFTLNDAGADHTVKIRLPNTNESIFQIGTQVYKTLKYMYIINVESIYFSSYDLRYSLAAVYVEARLFHF